MYTFDSRVRYSECDQTGRLALPALVNYLQDCSTFQSLDLGRGVAAMSDERLMWVLATWRIDVARRPALGERVRVGTPMEVAYRRMARLGDELVPVLHERADGWDVDLTDGRGATYALVRLLAGTEARDA